MNIFARRIGWVIVGVGIASCALAAEPSKEQRQINVQGHGEVKQTPDQAKISIAVNAEGTNIETVTSEVRQKMQAVLKVVRAQGMADKDIQTQGYRVSPEIRWDQGRSKRVGFSASNRIEVTVHNLDKVGAVLSSSLEAGANDVEGPQYGFENAEALEHEALERAVADAKAKAEQLTRVAGVTLGEALRIEETGGSQPTRPMPFMMAAKAAAPSAPEPIEPGEETISASVTISFALR